MTKKNNSNNSIQTSNLHEQLESLTNGKLELNRESLRDIGLFLQRIGCELVLLSCSEQHKETQKLAKVKKLPCEFGNKYRAHFGINPYADQTQYMREYMYYYRHGFCRWELSNIYDKQSCQDELE